MKKKSIKRKAASASDRKTAVVRNKVGLALGSGSARGLAHLGVIRAIEEAGIGVDLVAGTSMGALIGSVYAAGKLDDLEATFLSFDWKKIVSFFDVVLPKSGLIDGARIGELVRTHVHSDAIEALAKPFAAVATDILTGEEVIIRAGDVIEAVRASISVPGIFTPVRSNGLVLVDGGITNPVPVSVARAMGADMVIAVDLNHEIIAGKNLKPLRGEADEPGESSPGGMFSRWMEGYRQSMLEFKARLLAWESAGAEQFSRWISPEEPLPSIFEVLLASINIVQARITQARLGLDRPDILIQPPLGHIRFLEFGRAEEIIRIGYESAKETLAAFVQEG